MAKLKILVVGGGAREHALLWKLAQSPHAGELFCAPGNGGTAALARNEPVPVTDLTGIATLAVERGIDLVMVGPEVPLSLGLADRLRAASIRVCGPSQAAARIESSKSWAKAIMDRAGVPTARWSVVHDLASAARAIAEFGVPVAIKADGLAAGKGVVIAMSEAEATDACQRMLAGQALGAAGKTVVIEEFLKGSELSVMALTDGQTIVPLPSACDYKRLGDGDTGPNTGGMGAYAPWPGASPELMDTVIRDVLVPTVAAMAEAGSPMQGVLYAGLMWTASGPKVIEFNARLGDPETQVVLPLTDADLVELLVATADGTLGDIQPIQANRGGAVGVVLASEGYPGPYQTDIPIVVPAEAGDDQMLFHAGTARLTDGSLITSGGRVLTAVGIGQSIAVARDAAYRLASQVQSPGLIYRRDIATREVD